MCRLLILKIHTDTEMISSAAHWFTSVLGTVNREYSERETKKNDMVVHYKKYIYIIINIVYKFCGQLWKF